MPKKFRSKSLQSYRAGPATGRDFHVIRAFSTDGSALFHLRVAYVENLMPGKRGEPFKHSDL